ncbi:hypothetical protein [Caldilinea sp.]|uniref:hypothetical protein n=1 Tax=Caldilinea sp. TaxID=2293560 RepID=UPI002C4843CF|nr:hypothetical protein [Anaerolineales bacterium]HQY90891.1 hypothetical protein [Caldilinea sp.]HRA65026.1 hypothetical protein [Caldilinea sp.]
MKIRFDKFTLVVLAIVGLLMVTAVFTVSRSGGLEMQESYRTEDAPDTPVFNAFLALKKGDLATARAQYSAQVLKDAAGDKGYGPLRGETYGYGDAARRLRVTDVKLDPQDADRAYVTVAIDTYSTGGIFNSGSTWTSERTVEVVREDGAWKINAQEYFW